jgi:hypothetical protein
MIYSDLKPQNLPEKLIWYYLVCTYPIYYLGGQYLLAPLLGCFLALYFVWQWWNQTPATPLDEQITIPVAVWIWIVGILMIEIALIIGHFDFNLGLGKTISSTINRWLRTWMLFPAFMLAGSLKIRPQLIYRAVCIVCIQSLLMAVIASGLNLPDVSYTSPLRVFGGGNFYNVYAFGTLLDSGELRLILFAPWSPALGLVANVYFFLASQEKNPTLKWLGIIGAIAMIVGSVSRLAIICLPLTLAISWFLMNIYRPLVQLGTGLAAFLAGFLAPTMINNLQLAREEFSKSRAGSSRVRAVLGRIALYRWQKEAFFWGHGSVGEHGPKVTGRMAIGTHHTWFSILYTHGLIGCLGLAVPLAWSLVELVFKAQNSQIAKVGLNIILVLIIFSGGENIDSLTYIYWPGLIILGISLQDQISHLAGTKNHLNTKNLLTLGV